MSDAKQSAAPTPNPTAMWQAHVGAAVLGTERDGPMSAHAGAPWDVGAEPEGAADPTRRYLRVAAALGVYESAGRAFARGAEGAIAIEACAAVERVVPSAARAHLAEMLHGERQALLAEWAAKAAAGKWNAPPEEVPELLRFAQKTKSEEIRRDLLAVAGARGRWLAAIQGEWQALYVATTGEDPAKVWATGGRAERLAVLRELRRTDPDRARALLDTTWREESAADRAAMLEAMAEGLHPEEEAWLEERLDDRSKQVRATAARLLSRLPQSAFARRMTERLAACVRYKPGSGFLLKKKPSLEVTLPEATDAAMERDSLEAKAERGMGAKAALLSAMVGLAPLEWWGAAGAGGGSAVAPEAWIAAALAGDWAAPLTTGWIAAAQMQLQALWAEALLAHVCLAKPGKKESKDDVWLQGAVAPLMACLPASSAERIVGAVLNDREAAARIDRIMATLDACAFAWSAAFSGKVVDWLFARSKSVDLSGAYWLRQLLGQTLALRLAPALADRLTAWQPPRLDLGSNSVERQIDEAAATLRFRREMLAALETNS